MSKNKIFLNIPKNSSFSFTNYYCSLKKKDFFLEKFQQNNIISVKAAKGLQYSKYLSSTHPFMSHNWGLFSIMKCNQTGNHPQEEVAKFDYTCQRGK